jgi:hypothetical protein
MQAQTAILLVLEHDGSFKAITDLSVELELSRKATRQDIKTGCQEVLDAINRLDLAETIVSKLSNLHASDTEKATSSIREALQHKGIL